MAGAWLYLRYTLPEYKTTATLLIKDDKKSSAGTADPLESFDMFGSKKNVENEVEVLQSKTLMQEVVKNLHLYAPVTVVGRVINQPAYLYSPITVEALEPDSLNFSPKIPFTYNAHTQTVTIGKSIYPSNQWVSTPFGILQFVRNKYYQTEGDIEKKEKFYFSLNNIKNTANNILSRLTVESSKKESTVIDLSIVGPVPQRGQDILNELLVVYNEASIHDKNVRAANTLKFVDNRLKYVVNELDSVEGKLQRFKANNRITDISAQGQIYLQSVATNDQNISNINMQLAVLDQVENFVDKKVDEGGIVPSILGVDDPVLAGLLQNLSQLELQYTQTKKIVPENNPAIISLVDGINKLKPEILENIHSQRKNLLASKNDLQATSSEYNSMLRTIPAKRKGTIGYKPPAGY